MKQSFQEGLKLILENSEFFTEALYTSYLVWDFEILISDLIPLGYFNVVENHKKIEIIAVIANRHKTFWWCYPIAKRMENRNWEFMNVKIASQKIQLSLFCDVCQETIDFKDKFYSKIIENYDTYDVCEKCYENKKLELKHEVKYIDFTVPRNYFGWNTYDKDACKLFTNTEDLLDYESLEVNDINDFDWAIYKIN